MTSNRFRRVLLGAAAVIALAACSAQGGPRTSSTSTLHVLAVETFLADIAQNVAGDRLKVETLLPAGIDPHEFQPRPQDAIKIAQSQVLIVNGLGYGAWLTKALQDSGGATLTVTASDGIAHGEGVDPHAWMNPLNAVRYAENIRDGLSKVDPAGKDVYAGNAQTYAAKLRELDQWIKGQVAQIPPERRLLVTNHDALGYFAEAYGFRLIGAVIPSVTSEASPSAQQMAELIQTIKASGAPAIFVDISENQKLAEQLASESGTQVVAGLYVETLSAAGGPASTHIDMLRHDAALIVEALK
jgi:ABC-type Zn uptake system ZnuABC Zn-binding protein ZnuA